MSESLKNQGKERTHRRFPVGYCSHDQYYEILRLLPTDQRLSVGMGELKDIRDVEYVDNGGASTCLIYFIEINGEMKYSGHFPISSTLETDDSRDPFSMSTFLPHFSTVLQEASAASVSSSIYLFGQYPMWNQASEYERANRAFIDDSLKASGFVTSQIHDYRKPFVRHHVAGQGTSVLYCRSEHRFLATEYLKKSSVLDFWRDWLARRRFKKRVEVG